MHIVYILLGGNIGNTAHFFQLAQSQLNEITGRVIQASSYYESEAWGFEAEQNFLNQVLVLETKLPPFEFLLQTQSIEKTIGRSKKTGTQGYESRKIDIDILFYDDLIIDTPNLCIPHPRLHFRRFTLEPLNEIAPDFNHPQLLKSMQALLSECPDNSPVQKK